MTKNLFPPRPARKIRRIAPFCVLLIFAFAFLVVRSNDDEPTYRGKTLSEWIRPNMDPNTEEAYPGAVDAIQAMGTNALPFCLKWMQREPGPLTVRLEKLIQKVPNEFFQDHAEHWLSRERYFSLGDDAIEIICALGPNATPALPELVRLMEHAKSPVVSQRAINCLPYIGPKAFPSVLQALARTNFPNRATIVSLLYLCQRHGDDVALALPILFRSLEEPDAGFALEAVRTLGTLQIEPGITVPVLISAMTNANENIRSAAVRAIRYFCESARPAVPQLILSLQDPRPNVRNASTNAIRLLAPELVGTVVRQIPEYIPPASVHSADPEIDAAFLRRYGVNPKH